MKAAFALSLASIAAAMPTARNTQATKFTGLAIHSGSEIQYLSVNADQLSLWLGRDTSTYCPEQAGVNCPSSPPPTAFVHGADSDGLSMSTTVPGGQICYVDAAGNLKFTQAHSANTGEGSYLTGFSIDSDNHLQFQGQDWLACPASEEGQYNVYASSIKGSNNSEGCIGFAFRTQEVVEGTSTAWQYN